MGGSIIILSLYAFIFKLLIEYVPGLWLSLVFRIIGCTKVNEWRLGVWGGTVQSPWLCAAVSCLLRQPAQHSKQHNCTADRDEMGAADGLVMLWWVQKVGDTSALGTLSEEMSLFCAELHCASPGSRSPKSSTPMVTAWSQRMQGTCQCLWDGGEVSMQGNL